MARTREKIRWNIGMVVFLVIFIYVIINVGIFLGKKKLTVYKVTEDKITNTVSLTGIAIRDEELLRASQKGYITYYVEEGKRIKKTGTAFILDKDGKVQDAFADQVETIRSKGETMDNSEIQQRISEYQSINNDDNFSNVYDLKYELKNVILNISEASMKSVIDAVEKKLGADAFQTMKSNSSGIATFYSDDFDGKSADDIKNQDFDQENYRITKYNSSDKVKKGEVVCRITKSEDWTIVVPLKKEQYNLLKEKKKVGVKFLMDQNKASADISVKKKGKQYFGYLTFDDYCVRYVDQRYLDLDITLDSCSGLKIPNSAITSKKFYQVPVEYISKGNDGISEGFSVRSTNKDGDVKVEQKEYTIYKKTDNYCYLDPEEVGENIVFQSMDSDKTYLVEKTKSLKGVYCTNRGYADFRPVEFITKKEDYSIVESETKQGVNLYDFIVLDSSVIEENQIIY